MSRPRLVVIGNGMAGLRVVEDTLALDPTLHDITVFSAEAEPGYNRVLLPEVLAGTRTLDQIRTHERDWYEAQGVTLHLNSPIARVQRSRRAVITADGTETFYDRLVLATGAEPLRPAIPGCDLPGVMTLRNSGDVRQLDAAISAGARTALVIGGGPLGLEAASSLARHGIAVSVAHLPQTLMDRQLDEVAGELLYRDLERRGLNVLLQHRTVAILGPDRVRGVRFDDGKELPFDLILLSIGIRPNTELARQAGLYCRNGIVVNDTMQTFDPRVYGIGECVEHRGSTFGLVAPLYEQARVCANHLVRVGRAAFTSMPAATRLKVPGVDLYAAGDIRADAGNEVLSYRDDARGIYRKVVLRDNRVRGSVLIGDTAAGPWLFDLQRAGSDVSALREDLLFGPRAELDDTPLDSTP